MITIDDTINAGYGIFPGASESAADISSGFLADTVIFDIETTGFSPKSTHLYLIGAIYAKDGQIMLKQWFAENYMSESSVLCSFFEFIKPFRRISGYNISGFDIPYLLSKCISYKLPCIFCFCTMQTISEGFLGFFLCARIYRLRIKTIQLIPSQ